MKLTEKEFMEKVLASNLGAEMDDFASNRLAKIAEKKAKAKAVRLAKAEDDKPLLDAIVKLLTASNSELPGSVIADNCFVSCQKAIAMANKLAENGTITVRRVRIPKIGERNVYGIPKEVASN